MSVEGLDAAIIVPMKIPGKYELVGNDLSVLH